MNSRKHVVILGALSAMAISTARLLAKDGHSLLLAGRNGERLADLASDLKARGAADAFVCDIDLVKEATGARGHLSDWNGKLGGVDQVLIFYGYLGDQSTATENPAELDTILTVNFTSAAHWSVSSAEYFKKQGSGALVAIGSVAGDRGRQSNFVYGAAKSGLETLIEGIAHDLADTGARAVVIKPGFVDTPMTADFDKNGPLWAKPDAIAKLVIKATTDGGPVQYAPRFWWLIMRIIRLVPTFVFHRTKL